MNAKGTNAASSRRSSVRKVWDTNAEFWDSRMGEGNEFHLKLLLPALERLLDISKGDRVLDIACGNGQLSRWMAARGAFVTAIDVSGRMIEIAKSRGEPSGGSIEYHAMDASDPAAFRSFGRGAFDKAVCNMAIMDMPDIGPLSAHMPRLLKRGGRFVFSVTHPCFNTSDMRKVAIESEENGLFEETFGIQIHRYLTPREGLGFAMSGQPVPQHYFERPLHMLIGSFLEHGLLLDALEEPGFGSGGKSAPGRWYLWENFSDIPPVLLVRFASP